jgi:hypothetical protein
MLKLPEARGRTMVTNSARHQPGLHRSEDGHESSVIHTASQHRWLGIGVDRLGDSNGCG